MEQADRLRVSDWALARETGAEVHLGRAFLFLGSRAFAQPGLRWVTTLFGGSGAPRPRVVSLLGVDPVGLPGVSIAPLALAPLALATVTSDKALYREGKDDVRLLTLDPLAPSSDQALEILVNGADFGQRPVSLGAAGAAAVTLRDLPAGDYEIRLRGAPAGAPSCRFTVAAYKLAPLVASLRDRSLDPGSSRLAVSLLLEAFGVPVDGAVLIELLDRGRRISRQTVVAERGIARVTFKLDGEGPHVVNVQLAADPSRTASVPIVGSRAAERTPTIFSTLGTEVSGSLLPSPGARPVRGIFLEEGAERTSPLRLERVDATRARLRAMTAVEALRVVTVDPTFPQPRPGAVDPSTARHPGLDDPTYQRAEKLFLAGKFTEARALFELAMETHPGAHPNYAYYVACCRAKEGDPDAAVAALRLAIEAGWRDLAHAAADDDLSALRGHAPFESLLRGGRREMSFDDVAAGAVVELEAEGPLSVVALGAFVGGKPWEGWAALLAPDPAAARVVLPEHPAPGTEVIIDIETGGLGEGAWAYVIVKDARLLSADTPASRLAGQLKACAASAAGRLTSAGPQMLTDLIARLPPPAPMFTPTSAPSPQMYRAAPPLLRAASPFPGAVTAHASPLAYGGASPAGSPPTDGGMPPPPAPGGAAPAGGPRSPLAARPLAGGLAAPLSAAAPRGAATAGPAGEAGEARVGGAAGAAPRDEPEVLYAGLVQAEGGYARLRVKLAPGFADYVVEALVLRGLDWAFAEARFRAEKIPFVALDLPAFVDPGDAAIGRVTATTQSERMRVRVLRDGVELRLVQDGRTLEPGEALSSASVELRFLATPGEYSAVVEDLSTGAADWARGQVEAPGKLRRLARTTQILRPGEQVTREGDVALLALRVLPGLDRPFAALLDATADYGHACCEQTAAKMLAACGMYALAEGDGARRDRAEAIILAGARRQASMWLPGLGFKMYPESSAEPNAYWGSLAARHLWNLAPLRELGPGKALLEAVDRALAMAADASKAYRVAWPPAEASSAEQAYGIVRFGLDGRARERATAWVAERAARGDFGALGGAVARRAECAYAAAVLLRAGGAQALPLALGLANIVTRALGEQGRLYSTVDSVAAIALMAELRAAGVVGQAGRVDLDGQQLSTREAVKADGQTRTVTALEGVVVVEATRLVEEDWGAFAAVVPLRVALERDARPGRRFAAGDAVDLRVTLENGYKPGDLLWVCLPDGLSRVAGGGQIKRFSVDFEGKSELVVALAATSLTVDGEGKSGPQRFAVCVRNMFEEERAGNPGPMVVTVEPGEGSGAGGVGRVLQAFRGLFG